MIFQFQNILATLNVRFSSEHERLLIVSRELIGFAFPSCTQLIGVIVQSKTYIFVSSNALGATGPFVTFLNFQFLEIYWYLKKIIIYMLYYLIPMDIFTNVEVNG